MYIVLLVYHTYRCTGTCSILYSRNNYSCSIETACLMFCRSIWWLMLDICTRINSSLSELMNHIKVYSCTLVKQIGCCDYSYSFFHETSIHLVLRSISISICPMSFSSFFSAFANLIWPNEGDSNRPAKKGGSYMAENEAEAASSAKKGQGHYYGTQMHTHAAKSAKDICSLWSFTRMCFSLSDSGVSCSAYLVYFVYPCVAQSVNLP